MTVKVTKDNVNLFVDAVRKLTAKEVLVGIPKANVDRQPTPDDPNPSVNNAELGYIHEFGAPEANIPPRPFLIPGVKSIQPQSVKRLKAAAKFALEGNLTKAMSQMDALGLIAQEAVQVRIKDGIPPPIKEATKMGRLRRKTSYKNATPARKRKMMEKWLAGDFTPLIDTGSLYQSITYVVADKGKK